MIFNMGNSGVNLGGTSATTDDIRKGKTAGIKSGLVEGTMEEFIGGTFTPGTSDQVISGGKYLADNIIIKGDSDLTANNIRKGVDIFGVLGAMVQGATGIDYGVVTYSSMGSTADFSHNLGVIPSNVFLIPISLSVTDSNLREYAFFNTTRLTMRYSSSSISTNIGSGVGVVTKTTTNVKFNLFYGLAPGTYYWFAIA